ncbi:hypothetical protein GJ496_004901 [Pomphorhynchus laevis]|nr:hypothetical protein GJ496_004901 [Pomphorhynchus laevis]
MLIDDNQFSEIQFSDTFDSVTWFNNATSDVTTLSDLEDFITDTIVAVEKMFDRRNNVITQKTKAISSKIDRSTFFISNNLESIEQSATQLSQIADDVSTRVAQLDYRLDSVEQIHVERNNIQETVSLLEKSKEWVSTLMSLKTALYRLTAKHSEINELFIQLQESLNHLSIIAGHEKRMKQWNDFRDQWTSILGPHLIETFQLSDLAYIKEEINSLRDIGLYEFVIDVYTDFRKNEFISECHFNFLSAKSLTESCDQYLNAIMDLVALSIEYCREIFDSPLPLIRQTNVLLSMRIDALCNIEKGSTMKDVVECKKRCDCFINEMANISSMYNIPKKEEFAVGQCFLSMGCILSSIFVNRVQSYIDFEKEAIREHDTCFSWIPELNNDQTPVVSKALPRFITYCNKSLKRCHSLTNDMLICQYHQFIKNHFEKFANFLDFAVNKAVQQNGDSCYNIVDGGSVKTLNSIHKEEDHFLNFRLLMKLMILVGQYLSFLKSFEEILFSKIQYVSLPPAVNDGICQFAIKNAGRQLFVDLKDFEADCDRLKSVKTECQSLFPSTVKSLSSISEKIVRSAIQTLISPINDKLDNYCQNEIYSRVKPLVNGLPSYSTYPSDSVSEATKHILFLAQNIDQYIPDDRQALFEALGTCKIIQFLDNKEHYQQYAEADIGFIWMEHTCIQIVERLLRAICKSDFKIVQDESFKQILIDLEQMQAMLEHVGVASYSSLTTLLNLATGSNNSANHADREKLPPSMQKLCTHLYDFILRQKNQER